MQTESDKYLDFLIVHFQDPMVLFEIERKMPSKLRFTIGQLTHRALILNLAKWANQYPLDELAKMVNYHPEVLEKKIKLL